MPRSANRPTAEPGARELPPERAFVVHLDVQARPPRQVVGRIEHVTSGQVAHVTSLDELAAFMAKVLRNRTHQGPRESDEETAGKTDGQSGDTP